MNEGIVIKRIISDSPLENLVNDGDVICSFNDGENNYKLLIGETTVPGNQEKYKGPLVKDVFLKR